MRAAAFVLGSFLLVGCLDLASESPEPEARVVANSINFGDLEANQVALTDLAGGDLDLDSAPGQALIGSQSGRNLVAFLVACALPRGQTASGRSGGVRYTFDGELGLANGWKTGAPSFSERRWVSGCMLARVNNYGQAMKISIHGPHAGLFVNNSDRATFTLEEGSFYGDIFTGSAPLVGWSCRGVAQQAGDPGTGSAIDSRDCAEKEGGQQNICGWGWAGECNVSTSSTARACDVNVSNNAGYYTRCHDGTGALVWDEVITVYDNSGAPLPPN